MSGYDDGFGGYAALGDVVVDIRSVRTSVGRGARIGSDGRDTLMRVLGQETREACTLAVLASRHVSHPRALEVVWAGRVRIDGHHVWRTVGEDVLGVSLAQLVTAVQSGGHLPAGVACHLALQVASFAAPLPLRLARGVYWVGTRVGVDGEARFAVDGLIKFPASKYEMNSPPMWLQLREEITGGVPVAPNPTWHAFYAGALLYRLLAPIWPPPTFLEGIAALHSGRPPMTTWRSDLDELAPLIDAACGADPAGRPSMNELLDALRARAEPSDLIGGIVKAHFGRELHEEAELLAHLAAARPDHQWEAEPLSVAPDASLSASADVVEEQRRRTVRD